MKTTCIIATLLFASFSLASDCLDETMHDLAEWSNNDFFKSNSGYSDILVRNVNMVKEASKEVSSVVKDWLNRHPQEMLTYLDVASGTDTPVVSRHLFDMLNKMNVSVDYTAIDINQKLGEVQTFQFPQNVKQQNLVVADAYHVESNKIVGKKFSIIYFGLNLHHLNPQELFKVLRDYKNLLAENGLLIVFDVIRPNDTLFIERPRTQSIISADLLVNIPTEPLPLQKAEAGDDWRIEFAQTLGAYAEARGVAESTVTAVQDHILGNDYPLSMDELTQLLEQTKFSVHQIPFSPKYNTPVAKYFGVLVASN